MNIRITRSVVVATASGLRHFAPGLTLAVSDEEGVQILRQQAGIAEAATPVENKKPAKGKAGAAQSPAAVASTEQGAVDDSATASAETGHAQA